MNFTDRKEAGHILADRVGECLARHAEFGQYPQVMVAGIPHGGAIVAREIARRFGAPMELIVTSKFQKLGSQTPCLAVISSDGAVAQNNKVSPSEALSLTLHSQREAMLKEAIDLERTLYEKAGRYWSPFNDKILILVDEAVDSGTTAKAALASARLRGAGRIFLAVPVITYEAMAQLRPLCDEVVSLLLPEKFEGMERYYLNCKPVTNLHVIESMRESAHFPGSAKFIPTHTKSGLLS